MNILFLTLGKMDNIRVPGTFTDILRQFVKAGHEVYVVSANERRRKEPTKLVTEDNLHNLQVKTGNIRACGFLEKGISTVTIQWLFRRAVKKYFPGVRFDLVISSTPPITLAGTVRYFKRRDHAKTYLLLKDIFPQNAVDLGVLTKKGPKSLIYRYFRRKEKQLYAESDFIGCMSPKNCEFLIEHNGEALRDKTEVCPNSIEVPSTLAATPEEKRAIREEIGLPVDKKIFVYGGNLGKAQGIGDMIACFEALGGDENAVFLIIGKGTDFSLLQRYIDTSGSKNVILKDHMPKTEYEKLVWASDVGLIFLDHRFTIPNFPSRLLSYLTKHLPVLSCTDPNTDIGQIAEKAGFGWNCRSDRPDDFARLVKTISESEDLAEMGEAGYRFLCENYDVRRAYQTVISHFEGK